MEKKGNNQGKVGAVRFWAWQSGCVSMTANFIVVSFLMLYCTDALNMSAALVGTLLMVSKIADGITDLFAGYLVDKTNTRWGKGRPYEFAIIGVWFCTWLMFSAPAEASMAVKGAWVLAMYIFVNAIFATLINASGNPYMIRAFENNDQRIRIASFGGVVIMVAAMAVNIIFPIAMGRIAVSPAGWSKLIAMFAVPLTLIGMLRFFLVKETNKVDITEEKVKFKDVLIVLRKNPYMYIIAAMQLVYALATGTGVAGYYYKYVVENTDIMGFINSASVIVIPMLFFFPLLMKKVSMGRLVQIGCIFYGVGGLMTFIAKANIPLLIAATLITAVGVLPITYLTNLMMLDCGSYNAWKGYQRMDGTIGAIKGFANKLGSAFGSGLMGILLTAAGYQGDAAVQSESAVFTIRAVMGLIPGILFIALALLMIYYNRLDRMMPEINSELARRAEEAGMETSI